MEKAQRFVRDSLNHFGYYNKHEVDFNIKGSQTHTFTMPKDADFIVANIYGEIGWIEVKATSGYKFYVSNQPRHQWARALQLGEKHGTYYYIVHFKDYETYYWFTPMFVQDAGGIFDPREHPDNRIMILKITREGTFHKKTSSLFLNLHSLPFFQKVQNPLTRHVLESGTSSSQVATQEHE